MAGLFCFLFLLGRLVDFVGMSARRHVERCLDLAIDVIQRDISHYILNVMTHMTSHKSNRESSCTPTLPTMSALGATDIW